MKNALLSLLFMLLAGMLLQAQDAPDFEGTDIHGEVHQLYADYLDRGMTVVLDLFFVDCPPCQELAPAMQPLYEQYGSGNADVQFLSITGNPADNDAYVQGFEDEFGTTWPAIGLDGGGADIEAPYINGDYGEFFGYPTVVIISPDGTVNYDIWGADIAETIVLMDTAISETGATGEVMASAPSASFDFEVEEGMVSFSDGSQDADSWMWDFGNGDTSMEQSPAYTYDQSGTYEVCLTVSNSAGEDEICNDVTVALTNTALEDLRVSGLELYPNPVSEILNVEFDLQQSAEITISITDLAGKQVAQAFSGQLLQGLHQLSVPVRDLATGIYLLDIETATVKSSSKFVVR